MTLSNHVTREGRVAIGGRVRTAPRDLAQHGLAELRRVDLRRELEPRDRVAAARTATALIGIAALVTLLFAVVLPPDRGADRLLASCLPAVFAVVALLVYRTSGHGPRAAWALAPVVSVLLVAAVDVATRDATAGGQVFFCFPVIYAAAQLRPPAAYAVLAVTCGCEATVVTTLLPPQRALTDATYVGVTLASMAVLLVRAGRRQDALVAELRRQAAIDPLTGLVTRRVLDDAAHCALTSASAEGGTVLILVDLDHFKSINDGYGHPVGDDALVHLAGVLNRWSRPQDVVSRMGGDEMALLLPGCTLTTGLERAEAISAAVRAAPLPTGTGPVDLSVSIGVAHAPRDADDLRSLYACADAVLYEAKRGGRGRVGRVPDGGDLART